MTSKQQSCLDVIVKQNIYGFKPFWNLIENVGTLEKQQAGD